MEILLLCAVVLTGIDTGQTLSALAAGYVEANPAMVQLAQQPVAFVAVKAGVTAGLATWLWRHRHLRAARWAALVWVGLEAVIVAHNWRAVRR
jgi:hypothetical protein